MLKTRALAATFWSGTDVILRQGLQFLLSLFLARLLTPEDFGVVALLGLFISIASLFIDGYLNTALVQRRNVSHEDESTVFWFNVGAGAVVALALVAVSPAIALFYDMPLLRPLTWAMALNLFIGAFGAVHVTLLSKALEFRMQMKIGGIATSLSGGAAILLAWQGAGLWALVGQVLISSAISTILLWRWHPWRPLWRFRIQTLRVFFKFSGFLMVAGLFDTVSGQLHTLIIGKLYGARDLGLYGRAMGMQQVPSSVISGILNRVAFVVFAAAAADKTLLRHGVRKALLGVMMLNIPIMLGLMVTAERVIVTLFGDKWLPSAPILEVLCLVGLLTPLHTINLNVLVAQGQSRQFLRIEIAKKVITIATLVAASSFGVLAIAWSQVSASVICYLINAYYTGVMLHYAARDQLRDLFPYLVVAGVMAVIVWLIGLETRLATEGVLALQVVGGATFYLGVCKLLHLSAFEDAWNLLFNRETVMVVRPVP